MAPIATPAHIRVLDRSVTNDNGCIVFTGAKAKGYGRVTIWEGPVGGRYQTIRQAHRVVYEAIVGPIPNGLTIDHLCSNKACVNVDHMEVVSLAENTKRGNKNKRKPTHCPQGHEYSDDNTYTNSKGHRFCRTCGRAATLRWYHNKKRDTNA